MQNWSVDIKQLKKNKKKYAIWRLEQLVNFGLGKEKLKRSELKKHWSALNLDPKKKKYISWLLWPSNRS